MSRGPVPNLTNILGAGSYVSNGPKSLPNVSILTNNSGFAWFVSEGTKKPIIWWLLGWLLHGTKKLIITIVPITLQKIATLQNDKSDARASKTRHKMNCARQARPGPPRADLSRLPGKTGAPRPAGPARPTWRPPTCLRNRAGQSFWSWTCGPASFLMRKHWTRPFEAGPAAQLHF